MNKKQNQNLLAMLVYIFGPMPVVGQFVSLLILLIEKRNKFREEGNYSEADIIRKQIQDLGFNISDKPLK